MPAGTSTRSRRSTQIVLFCSLPPSRLCGESRSSLPCTLTCTVLLSIATFTPTAPDTSSRAPASAWARLPAVTAIWPPVASVSESPSKFTSPPETISTRD